MLDLLKVQAAAGIVGSIWSLLHTLTHLSSVRCLFRSRGASARRGAGDGVIEFLT